MERLFIDEPAVLECLQRSYCHRRKDCCSSSSLIKTGTNAAHLLEKKHGIIIIFPGTSKTTTTTSSTTTAPSSTLAMKKLFELLVSSCTAVTRRRHHGARHVVNESHHDHNDDNNDDSTACDTKSSYTSPTTTPEDEEDQIVEDQDIQNRTSDFPQQPANKLDINNNNHDDDDNNDHSCFVNHKEASPAAVAAATTAAAAASVPVNPHCTTTRTTTTKSVRMHHNMINNMNVLYDHEHHVNNVKNDDDDDDINDDKDTAKDDDSTTALADQSRTSSSTCSSSSLSKFKTDPHQQALFRRGLARRRRRLRQPPTPPPSPPCLTNHHHHATTISTTNTSSSFSLETEAQQAKTTIATAATTAATKSKVPPRLPLFWTSRMALQTLLATSSSSCPSRLENIVNPDPDEVRKRSAFLLLCFVMNALVVLRACVYHRVFGYYNHPSNIILLPVANVLLVGVNVMFLIVSLTAKHQHHYYYHYRDFVRNQLLLLAVFPLLEHVYLGGWQASGAVVLWSFLAPLGATFFQSSHTSKAWFQYLLVCIVPLMMYEIVVFLQQQQQHQTATSTSSTAVMTTILSSMNLLGTMSILFAAAQFWSSSIENNQSRLQDVLQQFLPSHVATCMLQQQQGCPSLLHHHDQVSLLSIRVVDGGVGSDHRGGGSGKDSDWLLTDFLQEFFHGIDQSVQQHKRPTPLTKVKTMGNVYLVAGGLEEEQDDNSNIDNEQQQQQQQQGRNVDDYSTASTTTTTTGTAAENHHAAQLLRLGAELFPLLDDVNRRLGTSFDIRMGLHVGPVIAGVLMNNTPQQQQQQQQSHLHQQLSYDVWGHSVDVVHDLQLQSLSACGGLVHLSQDAYDKVRHLQDLYLFATRSGSSSSSNSATVGVALGTNKTNNARTYFCKPKLFTSSSICSIGSCANTAATSKEYR